MLIFFTDDYASNFSTNQINKLTSRGVKETKEGVEADIVVVA